jgi:hypothetical protein
VAKSRHEGADNSNRSRHQRAVDCREMIFVGDGLSVHLLGLRLNLAADRTKKPATTSTGIPRRSLCSKKNRSALSHGDLKYAWKPSHPRAAVLFATPTDHELVGPRLTLFKPPG